MSHTAPPPSKEEIARVRRWNDKLCFALAMVPDQFNLTFQHKQLETSSDDYPVWVFASEHHTLPSRKLLISIGIPEHEADCQCLRANGPRLVAWVIDTDTDEDVPDSGHLEINYIRNFETVAVTIGGIVSAFSHYGTL